ncbi:MAG TPA: tetratricopeptide repeat protein [Desulfomonilaceae bacterium]|nr:tetratricopeptide repeat protein [Desulfomonilaceae bacterium]
MTLTDDVVNEQTSDQVVTKNGAEKQLFSLMQLCVIFLIFFAVGFVIFHKGYHSAMVYDSAAWIVGKAQVYGSHDLLQIISIVPTRPLFMLSLYLNYVLTGMDPYYFRLLNTAFLAAASLVLAWLILVILELPSLRVPGTRNEKKAVSLFLGLLFVVHPLQSYVVLYDWQREAIMACLFYFSALAVYLGVRSGRFHRENLGYILTPVLFFTGLLSKENLVTLPVIMFMAEVIFFPQSFRQLVSRSLVIALLTLPPLAAYALMAHSFFGPESQVSEGMIERLLGQYSYGGISPAQVLLTEPRVFFSYLLMMLAPVPQFLEFIRAQPVSSSLLTPPVTLFALAGLFGLIAAGAALVRRYPLVSFGILFCIITIMPESLMIPNYLFFGYRAILPMVGIIMIMAYALVVLFSWTSANVHVKAFRPALSTALVFTLIALAAVSFGQARKWNPLQFWKIPADALPPFTAGLERVAYLDIVVNCALELINSGKYAETIDLYGKACSIPSDGEKAISKIAEEPDRGEAFRAATENLLKNFANWPDRTSGVLLNLGVALAASGNLPEAMNQYKKAIEIYPYGATIYLNLGAALEASNKLSEAIQEYAKAVAVEPNHVQAYNTLAAALKRSGDLENAVEAYRVVVGIDPLSAAAYKNLGMALEESDRCSEAVKHYRKALELEPRSAEAHLDLGRALRESDNVQEAITVLRKAVEIDPASEAARTQLGFALQESGYLAEAVQEYKKAVEIDPNSMIAYNNMGMALKKLGNLTEAVAAFRKAVQIHPNLAIAHYNLGSTLEQLGRLGPAIDHYRNAIEINPDIASAHHSLGLALKKSGDLPAAVEEFKNAIDLDSNVAIVHRDLGRTFEEAGELDNALECYRAAARLDPDSAEANLDLAKCLSKTGRSSEAIERYRKVAELKPDSVETLADVSVAMLRAGSIPDAIATLGKALALNKESADLFNALGCAFAEMKRMPEAAEQFRKALATDPNHSGSKQNLERFNRADD